MARNGSGTYILPAGNPVASGTVIESTWANDTLSDIATALTGSLPVDGQRPMSAQLKLIDGSAGTPAFGFNSSASTGIFLPAVGSLAVSVSGVETLRAKSNGNVMIGTTTDSGFKLNVNGTLNAIGAVTLASTLALTGAATLSSALTVAGTTTLNGSTVFNAVPILQTAAGSAQLEFRENDQTLPAGRWRFTADADSLGIRHNTAVAGDFSTYSTPLIIGATNNVTIANALSVGGTLTGTGAATLNSTLDVAGATTLSSSLAVTGAATLSSTLNVTGVSTFGGVIGSGTSPYFQFNETDQTLPAGRWRLLVSTDQLSLQHNTAVAGDFSTVQNVWRANADHSLTVIQPASFSSTVAVTGALSVAGVTTIADGTAAAPGIAFATDTNTGIYRIGENQLGVATAGALQLTVSNTVVASAQPVRVPDGTAAAPSLSFSSDTNTGIYSGGADVLAIATAGTVAATFDASGNTNISGGLGVRAGVPSAAYGIVSSYDRTVNSATYGLNSLVNLTSATLTADRNNYGVYSIVEGQYQNAAAFTNTQYGVYGQSRTSATAGNSVNGEGTLTGVYGYANHATGDATYTRMENAYGVYGIAQSTGTTSLVDQAYGVYSLVRPTNAGATITTAYLFYGTNSTVTGTLTNRYGVYIASAINNYFAGGIQIGGTATGPSTAEGLGVGVAPPGVGLIEAAGSVTTATQFLGNATDGVSAPSFSWTGDPNTGMYRTGADGIGLATNGVNRVSISTAAVTVNNADTVLDDIAPTSTLSAGFRAVPQNSKSAAYTLVLTDAGKHIYHPSADVTARIWTIPANSSVAFPIGTSVTFVNDASAGVITISITTDTLVQAGTGSTGSRTLAANGVATALKITSTRWIISGTGLT